VCVKWMTSVRDKNYYYLSMLKVFRIVQKVFVLFQTYDCIQDVYQCGGISIFDTDYILACDEANIMVVINLVLGIREYNALFGHDTFYIAKNRDHSPCVSKVLW